MADPKTDKRLCKATTLVGHSKLRTDLTPNSVVELLAQRRPA
jgi:hypothetical protein